MFATGLIERGQFLSARAIEGNGELGVTTAKKIGCNARRNREKRRLKSALQRIPQNPRLDLVLVLAPSGERVAFDRLVEDLQTVMERLIARWAAKLESI